MKDLKMLENAIIDCNINSVKELTQDLINNGLKPVDIINLGLINGMNVVGERFKEGDMYVPEVLMAAKAMNIGMSIVKPLLMEGDLHEAGKVVLGTVDGDLHDIGKNLVGMMMESSGLTVIDMGIDVPTQDFVAAIKEHKPDILALSALLTTTMGVMKNIVKVLGEEGLRDQVKVIIGGAPVTQSFADEIGADGWAPDAASAKDLAQKLILGNRS
jgi:5-methyltetrahydrofolate--homocysteine methyltransferase